MFMFFKKNKKINLSKDTVKLKIRYYYYIIKAKYNIIIIDDLFIIKYK